VGGLAQTAPPSPPRLLRGALGVAVGLTLAVIVWTATVAPVLALAIPALAALLAVTWLLRQQPLAPLAVAFLLAGFALTRTAGVQPVQVVFAGYYLVYLGAWYALRVFVYRERLVRHVGEVALVFFLLYATASLGLTVVYGGDLFMGIREWVALSMLAFYFPVREACERYPRGIPLVIGIIVYLGLLTSVRNVLVLQEPFALATYAWEVARARATTNEMMLLTAAVMSLVLGATARRPLYVATALFGFTLFTVGVVLTQWRAYYVSLALGVLVLVTLLRRGERAKVIGIVSASALIGTLAAYLVVGDLLLLLAYGLLDRALSITTAASADISFINRLLESRAVWEHIAANPIAGHGLGTNYGFHDITTGTEWVKSYAHNGYLSFWYKLGIFGLGALLAVWVGGILDGLRALRSTTGARRVAGLFAVALLVSLFPSFGVSAPFTTGDTVICFTLAIGLAGGAAGSLPFKSAPRTSGASTP
jgi:O-antigen ligase